MATNRPLRHYEIEVCVNEEIEEDDYSETEDYLEISEHETDSEQESDHKEQNIQDEYELTSQPAPHPRRSD